MGIVLALEKEVWNSFNLGMKNFFIFHALRTKLIDNKIQSLYYSGGYDSNRIKEVLDRDSIPYEERHIGYEEKEMFLKFNGIYVNCKSFFNLK